VGLTSQVSSEEHTNGTSSVRTKDYSYDAWGQRTGMTQTLAGGAPAQYTYAQDPHGSVSMLLDKAGTSTAQYGIQRVPAALTGTVCDGYQPYGDLDSDLSAGDESPNLPTNPYRYTGKRYDSGSKTLDMGARRFSPDTGRFLQMDTFSGALADMALGTDPLTQNRYALAGGNPISFVEVDGHCVDPAPGSSGTRYCIEAFIRDSVAGGGLFALFEGDDRGPHWNGGTYKMHQGITGTGDTFTSAVDPGTSRLVGDKLPMEGYAHDCGATETLWGGGSREIHAYCAGSIAYLFGSAPPFWYDLTIHESYYSVTISAAHSLFPSFEVWQYSGLEGRVRLVYYYDEGDHGPMDLIDLNLPMPYAGPGGCGYTC